MSNPTNEHMARVLAAHGVPQANIQRLIQARQKQADWVQSHFPDESNPSGGNMSNEAFQQINASLKEVGGQLKEFKANIESEIQSVRADVQHVQQTVAMNESRGGGPMLMESAGSEAARKLQDDPQFQAAADAVGRGVRAGRFSARVNLDAGIRAAITNVGVGQLSDSSYPASPDRRSDVVLPPERRLRLLDILPVRSVGSNEVEYVRMQATGEAGEQLKEGDLKAELQVDAEKATAKIATVAAWTKASRQILDDAPQLASIADRLLRYKVHAKLEALVVNGTGGEASQILGLVPLATAFTPSIGATAADIVGELITEMGSDGYRPNAVILHPRDWFRLQITRRGDNDAAYVFGSPTNPIPPVLWNAPVVASPAIAEGSALVLDTAFTTILDRMQAQVMIATENEDDFVRNMIAILAELRAGLEVADTGAVRIVTLPAPTP